MKKIFIYLVFIFVTTSVFAQIDKSGLPYIETFSRDTYLGHYQVWSAVQDNRGVLFFATTNSIVSFDGKNWKRIFLPKFKHVRVLSKDKNGKIYVGGENEFGYLSIDSIGRYQYKSLNYKIPESYKNFNECWHIYVRDSLIIVQTTTNLFLISDDTTQVVNAKEEFYRSYCINNKLYIREDKIGLMTLNNDELNLVDNGSLFKENMIFAMVKYQNDILIADEKSQLYIYKDNEFNKVQTDCDDLLSKSTIYKIKILKNGNIAIATTDNGLLILDNEFKVVEYLDKNSGLADQTIYDILEDRDGNLWLCTETGINKIELGTPFRIIDKRLGLKDNPVDVELFKDYLYISGGKNIERIKISDWNYQQQPKFEVITNTKGQNWYFLKLQNYLYCTHNPGIIKWNNEEATFLEKDYLDYNIWKILPLKIAKDSLYLASFYDGFILLKAENGILKYKKKITGFKEEVRNFFEDQFGNIWVNHSYKGIYKLVLTQEKDSILTTSLYSEDNILPKTIGSYAIDINNNILIRSNDTIYHYDYKKDNISKANQFIENIDLSGGIYLYGTDSLHRAWMWDIYGYKILSLDDMKITNYDSLHVVRFTNENFTKMVPVNKNIVLLVSRNGVYIYDEMKVKYSKHAPFKAMISEIRNIKNDSVIFGGNFIDQNGAFTFNQNSDSILKLEYNDNSLRFTYAAPTFYENDLLHFKFKLEGFDEEWSTWLQELKKDYTNLSPGTYTFKVKAIDIYNMESEIGSYTFTILRPWYKTYYAFGVYFIIFILLFIIAVRIYTRRLQKINQRLEYLVKERTREIDQKNEELQLQNEELLSRSTEIMQQKEEISVQAEQLEKVNEELEKLSIVASETDNAIIIMDKNGNFEWVNAAYTKIFGYTFNDLVSNISKNIIGKNTDEEIKEKVNECIKKKKTVTYQLETLHKNGQKLWVQTTLTPILNIDSDITNIIAIDSDITKLKKAEFEISSQNEHIKGSIRYALTIQRAILPAKDEINQYFEHFILYRPKDIVSGDFYWFTHIDASESQPELNYFATVDCTGHGVPGAFMSMIGNRLLNEIVIEKGVYDPGEILKLMDLGVKKSLKQHLTENRDGMDLCLVCIKKLDNKQYEINYGGAKIPLFYYSKEIRDIQKVAPDRKTIGGSSAIKIQFKTKQIVLNKGDLLILASDGLADQNNKQRKKFRTRRLLKIVKESISQSPELIKNSIEYELDNWQGRESQRDDITVMGVRL